jgi:hypothetical protein
VRGRKEGRVREEKEGRKEGRKVERMEGRKGGRRRVRKELYEEGRKGGYLAVLPVHTGRVRIPGGRKEGREEGRKKEGRKEGWMEGRKGGRGREGGHQGILSRKDIKQRYETKYHYSKNEVKNFSTVRARRNVSTERFQ